MTCAEPAPVRWSASSTGGINPTPSKVMWTVYVTNARKEGT